MRDDLPESERDRLLEELYRIDSGKEPPATEDPSSPPVERQGEHDREANSGNTMRGMPLVIWST
jgi:hypothetical protein